MSDDPVSPNASGKVSCPHCGAAHPVTWSHCPNTGQPIGTGKALVGRVIAERYRIVGVLAEGGMGTVYAAEHALVGRRVAIKRLHPELARDNANVERFQREARAAAAIGHENIVEVIDMGFAEDGAPYLAMEYLTGETLAAALRREGRLAPARACYVLGQVLAALDAVHAAGIVHRDLKPDNIFLMRKNGRADFVKVLDFGVSKMRAEDGGEASPLTRTGVMVGTPHYISPEQARGSRAHDHRVDIYAIGVILYETLTGKLPFDGHNYHALLQAILGGTPPPIHALAPAVPAGVVAVAERAMSRIAADRYPTAGEMLRALLPYGAVRPPAGDGFADAAPAVADPAIETRRLPRVNAPPAKIPSTAPARRVGRLREATSPAPPRRRVPSRPPPPMPAEGSAEARTVAAAAAPRAAAASDGLVPSPRAFLAAPRAFEARSDDWLDDGPTHDLPAHRAALTPAVSLPIAARDMGLGAPTPAESATESQHRTTPIEVDRPSAALSPREQIKTRPTPTVAEARSSRTTPEIEDEAVGDVPRVIGAFVGMALYHLRETFGIGGLERVLSGVGTDSEFRLRGALMTVPWVPASLLVDLATAAEASFGDGAGAVAVELGKGTGARMLGTSHKHLVQGLAPQAAIQKVPRIWRVLHDRGDVVVGRTLNGSYHVQVGGEAPRALAHARVMMGFYVATLEVAGARDVRAEILACMEQGTARTVTELRFR